MARVTDFKDSVNLRGLGPVSVINQIPSEGPHKVLITDMWKETDGKGTYRFSVIDQEPGAVTEGIQAQVVIGLDQSKDFNVRHLINSLLSIGARAEKLQGVIEGIGPAMFKGKTAYVFVKKPPEGEVDEETGRPRLASINFVPPTDYELAKRAIASMKTSTAPSSPPPTGANGPGPTPPTPPAAQATDVGSLFT